MHGVKKIRIKRRDSLVSSKTNVSYRPANISHSVIKERAETPKTARRKEIKFSRLDNDSNLLAMANDIWNGGSMESYTPDELRKLMFHLRQRKNLLTNQKKFEEAEKCEITLENVKAEFRKRQAQRDPDVELQRTMSKKKDDLIQINSLLLKEFDKQTKEQLEKLKKKQEEETKKFDEEWKTVKMRQYRKPSAELLNMRYQERSMILTRSISEAKSMDRIMKRETQKNMNESMDKLLYDYTFARNALKEKHKNEINALLQNRKQKRDLEVTHQKHNIEKSDVAIEWSKRQYKKTRQERFAPIYSSVQPRFKMDTLLPEIDTPNDTWQDYIDQKLSSRRSASRQTKSMIATIPDSAPRSYKQSIKYASMIESAHKNVSQEITQKGDEEQKVQHSPSTSTEHIPSSSSNSSFDSNKDSDDEGEHINIPNENSEKSDMQVSQIIKDTLDSI